MLLLLMKLWKKESLMIKINDERKFWYKVDVVCFFVNYGCFLFNMWYDNKPWLAWFNMGVALFCIYGAYRVLKIK